MLVSCISEKYGWFQNMEHLLQCRVKSLIQYLWNSTNHRICKENTLQYMFPLTFLKKIGLVQVQNVGRQNSL